MAESSPSIQRFLNSLNGRFREKQTSTFFHCAAKQYAALSASYTFAFVTAAPDTWLQVNFDVRRRATVMKPQDVAKSYDTLADHWNSDSFPRDNGIEAHKRALDFLKNRGKALDIGCGSSGRIVDLLLTHGLEVEGLDISQRMIDFAIRRHADVTFHHADICEWEFPNQYDFISAWDSIWHIPLNMQEAVLCKIFAGLSPGGVFIFTTGGVDEPGETRDSAMGPPMYHSAPGIPRVLEILTKSGCICRHLEYDQYPELHMYVIAQNAEPDA